MRFTGPETVSDAFGPKAIDPLHAKGNWATTRYIPWTSWAAAANIWPSASGTVSTEAESSGMAVFAHELSHNLGLPDNYNNPFAVQQQRTAGGMWDMMSRGSFNGPGGQHTRWMIPPTQGAALGAQHGIRNKQKLNFVAADDVLTLNRNGLAHVRHDGGRGQGARGQPGRRSRRRPRAARRRRAADKNPPCRYHTDPMCEGPWYTTATGTRSRPASTTTRSRSSSRSARTRSPAAAACCSARTRTRTPPAARSTARPGTSTPTRRTSTRSTTSRLTARPSRPRSATSARPTTARSTPARTRAPSPSSRPRPTTCTSTSSTSAWMRTASTATRSASARSPAPARRRTASSSATAGPRHRRGSRHLHVPAQEHGRGGDASRPRSHPSGDVDAVLHAATSTA